MPAVILGATEVALAAARDLAAHGVRVIAVKFGEGESPAAYSRRLELRNAPPLEDEAAVIDWLRSLAAELGAKAVLLPTLDQTVLLVHHHRAELGKHYRFFLWDSDVLVELASKAGLRAVAERCGLLPTPRTASPVTRAEAERVAAELRFPCIVKPEFTNAWWTDAAAELGLSHKAIEVADAAELLDVHARSSRIGARVVVQDKIVGPDSNHMSYVVMVVPDGSPRGELVVHKRRIHPPHFGVGSYAVVAADPDVIAVGRDVMRRLGYRGFASVQLKRDERDNRLYLIEINLRLPLVLEAAVRAGRSHPYYYYQICLDAGFDEGPLRVGQAWMSFRRDFHSMRVYAHEGTTSWVRWLWDLARVPAFAVFRWDDPGPAIVASWAWLRAAVKRAVARLGPGQGSG